MSYFGSREVNDLSHDDSTSGGRGASLLQEENDIEATKSLRKRKKRAKKSKQSKIDGAAMETAGDLSSSPSPDKDRIKRQYSKTVPNDITKTACDEYLKSRDGPAYLKRSIKNIADEYKLTHRQLQTAVEKTVAQREDGSSLQVNATRGRPAKFSSFQLESVRKAELEKGTGLSKNELTEVGKTFDFIHV